MSVEEDRFHCKDCVGSQSWRSDAGESQVEVECPEPATSSSDTRCKHESDLAEIGTILLASSSLVCKLVSQPKNLDFYCLLSLYSFLIFT